jgi:hypothetical protein
LNPCIKGGKEGRKEGRIAGKEERKTVRRETGGIIVNFPHIAQSLGS